MDGNLFAKHLNVLHKKRSEKEELIAYITEKTSVQLISEEIIIDGKKVKIHTSSVKKLVLQKNNIQNLLQEKGYYMF